MAKIKGYAPLQMTLDERKVHMKKNLDKKGSKFETTLELAVEGRFTNLKIWVGDEKCLADGGGDKKVYMRLDCANSYSVPLEEEILSYLKNPSEAMKNLVNFGFISDIECLDEILEITKDMCIRPCISW